jgi:hypothetical protein
VQRAAGHPVVLGATALVVLVASTLKFRKQL